MVLLGYGMDDYQRNSKVFEGQRLDYSEIRQDRDVTELPAGTPYPAQAIRH